MIAIMKCVTMRRGASLLAALLLCVLLCSVPVLADEAGGENSAASADTASEDTFAADSFFNQLEAGNGIGSTLFTAGAVLVGTGVVGIVCLIVWQCVSKRRDRVAEDREDIFDEIEQAEQRNRRRRAAEQEAREYEERIEAREHDHVPQQPARRYDPAAVTGEIPIVPDRALAYTVERPIVPRTPTALQPEQAASRPASTPAARPAAQAKPAARSQTASAPAARPAAQAKPAVRPQTASAPAAKPASPHKFDLDDILREVRESKNQ